ncbi:MAG: hypothetical protein V3R96_01375 [Dehalococcoidales bacterium]
MNSDYRNSLIPEFVQLVELSLGRGENMDDNIAIINQEPSRTGCAFTVMG